MYDYILFASSIGPTSTLTRQNSFTVIQRWITIKALYPLFVLCRVLRVTNAFYFLRFTGSVLTPPFELDAVRDAAWRLGRSQTSTRGARDIPDSGKPDSFFFFVERYVYVFPPKHGRVLCCSSASRLRVASLSEPCVDGAVHVEPSVVVRPADERHAEPALLETLVCARAH